MYRFSKTSNDRLKTCHKDLQLIMRESLAVSQVDFGIAQGARTVEQQRQYYKEGKSKISPDHYKTLEDLIKKAKHIVDGKYRKKAHAVDIYAYYDSGARWDVKHLCYLGGIVMATAKRLKQECSITHELRWGGNWDNHGIIITDQTFQDLPHFELI